MNLKRRIQTLERRHGTRGPCQLCGGQLVLQMIIDDGPEEQRTPLRCEGCGRPKYVVLITGGEPAVALPA